MNTIAVIVDEVPSKCINCENRHSVSGSWSRKLDHYKDYGCYLFQTPTMSYEELREKRNSECRLMTAAQYEERNALVPAESRSVARRLKIMRGEE